MADAITIKALQDASLDAKSLEEVVNGNEVKQVTTRKGETYPSVKKAIKTMFENGGLPATPFATKALMTASALVDGKYAMVTDDTVNNGLYVKTAGAWVKSGYDPLAQAKTYTDTAKSSAISTASLDATAKANAAEASALSYFNSSLITSAMTGQQLYDKALNTPEKPFNAVWSEYNKPIWHIGNRVFVDSVGAKLALVKEELVFKIKTTKENQRFFFPKLGDWGGTVVNVDWGDGTSSDVFGFNYTHDYTAPIGTEFTIRATGDVKGFGYSVDRAAINDSNYCLVSIEKNTLPRVTASFNFQGCTNFISACDGAFASLSSNSLANLKLLSGGNAPNLVATTGLFKGLNHVTNINSLLFGDPNPTVPYAQIPDGLLDVFVNATSASSLFASYTKDLPVGILDKLTELSDVSRMFSSAKPTSVDPRFFKNQSKLVDVTNCFYACVTTSDALALYNDMVRGNPTATAGCFKFASGFANIASVPVEWK